MKKYIIKQKTVDSEEQEEEEELVELTVQQKAKARRAASIVKGAGPKPPGHKLRKLCN